MTQRVNQFGLPIGEDVPGWNGATPPDRIPIEGRYCRLEALESARHLDGIFAAFSHDPEGKLWTYMPQGPFLSRDELAAWMEDAQHSKDPHFYALIDQQTGQAIGQASYLRIDPSNGVIEVGNIAFSPLLQRTPKATEAMFLMMKQAFDVWGYRRYEWKCDALNAASRKAAARFGFTYDGLFEQAVIYKGRNRDTTWYSILDKDWPRVKHGFETWLSPKNFDETGVQKQKLSDLING
ncbi:MAG: GNAT family N-acetyltransferase [Hyphomicrobiales bacterium]